MSKNTIRAMSIPRGLPLSGPDYTLQIHSTAYGGRDTVVQKQGNELTIDRPGVVEDYKITLGQDSISIEKGNGHRAEIRREGQGVVIERPTVAAGDVAIRYTPGRLEVDRQAAFQDVSYELAGGDLTIKREAAGKDVALRRTEDGFSIERPGYRPDLTIKLDGPLADEGLDMTVWAPRLGLEPEGYALVDRFLKQGLNPEDLLTVTQDGDVILWDRALR